MRSNPTLLLCCLLLWSCANIIPPAGGEKDQSPPVAIASESSKQVCSILFDELITLKNIADNFYTSPPLNQSPSLLAKGKTLFIEWEDSLQEQTAYLFHFGNSITDYNEGNVVVDYSCLLDNNAQADTFSVTGTITDALTKTPKKGVFAALYIYNVSNRDSLLYLKRPNYIAKTNENGRFHFPNLKNKEYLLFALADEDRSLTFNLAQEHIGFHNQSIKPDSTPINLLLFNELALADTLFPLTTDSLTEYGNLIIDSLPYKHQLLEILKNGKPIRQYLANTRLVIDSLPAGNYNMRIIIDANQNRQWDTGNLSKKEQAEIIHYYPEDIQLRANWELELIWKQ